jgi:uncharacterized membrane protein YbhN (UPF0104 family)
VRTASPKAACVDAQGSLPLLARGAGRVSRPPAPAAAGVKPRSWAGRAAPWLVPAVFTLAGGLAFARIVGSAAALVRVHVSWADLAAVAALYPVFAAVRGLRFRLLMARRPGWAESVGLGFLYSAACSILPGGLGEASLPALRAGVPGGAAEASAAVLLTRVQDLLSWLAVLVAGGLAVAWSLPGIAVPLLAVALLATAAGSTLVFAPGLRGRLLVGARRLPVKVRGFLGDLDAGLGAMASDGGSWGVTVALRLLSTAKYYFALRAFGAPVTLPEAAVGGALLALLLAIPVQGVAGLGTVEVWWIAILGVFGMFGPQAAVAALGTHVSLLLLSILCGGVALAVPPLHASAGRSAAP